MSNDDGSKPGNVIPFDFVANWKPEKSAASNSQSKAASAYGWMLDEYGKPINNLFNVLAALRHDLLLSGAIIFDEMLQAVCVTKPLPGAEDTNDYADTRPITDHGVALIQVYLQEIGLHRVGKDLVHQGVDTWAQKNRHHPVREWLAGLVWDGVPRVATWLSTYLGAPLSPYTSGVGTMAVIAMVVRIMEPGCKVDHMLVLEGPQGSGKSSVCKILGGRWFSDSLPDVTKNKDALVHLAGKWIIEVAEMSAMSRAETNRLKAFLSGTEDQFRPHYGRKEIKQKRQCVFIGTTNQTTYLKDETGGRRFWPVKTGKIDLDVLKKDRDQLIAEAVHSYNTGQSWHPTMEFEKQFIIPEQEARFETDAWEPDIRTYLDTAKPERVYLGEIFENVLHIEASARGRTKQNRITAILIRLGWSRLPKDSKGNIPWEPPHG